MLTRILSAPNIMLLTVLTLVGTSLAGEGEMLRDMSSVGPRTEEVDFTRYQDVRYVSVTTGSNEKGDGSKNNPWETLTHALSKINDASESKRYAILVAAGTNASGTIKMQEHVDLYGGFSPETWERNIFKYATVLDGGRVHRVVIGVGHARIDGFTITRGLARSHGGGILCLDASPTISNNVITDNFVLEPADFDHNHMYQNGHHGGGIASLYNSVPIIRNNVICGNKTSVGCGGGVAFYGLFRMSDVPEAVVKDNALVGSVQAVLQDNVICGNVSGVNDSHRTRSSSGGGILCAYEARPIIRNNVIAGNRARGRSDAGGIYCEYFSYPIISGNWIVGNVSDDDGGAIYTMRLGHPMIESNFIAGNWTTGGGVGGVRLSKEGRARIINNIIVHNQSGGGVQCIDSYMELIGNTIMHNQGGGAISYIMRFSYFPPSLVRNNIMRDNKEKPIVIREDVGRPMVVENNNMEGGYRGSGNFDKTPNFLSDGITGTALSAQLDRRSCTTEIVLGAPIEGASSLAGRVIRSGEKWGVIKEAHDSSITVWGDLSSANQQQLDFEVIPSYRTK